MHAMTETEHSIRSQEYLALIANTVPALVSYVDIDCRYQFCNAAYLEWFHLTEDQIIGHHLSDVLGDEAWTVVQPHIEAALHGETQEFEVEAPYAHGGRRWIHAIYKPHHDNIGHIIGVAILVLDITDRKQFEVALRDSRMLMEKALTIETVGILYFDLRGRIQRANPAFERMCGYTEAELRSIDWHILTAPEFWPATERVAERLATRGRTPSYQKQMVRKDGSRWWGHFAPTRLRASGADSECVEFIIDITEQKRVESQLRDHARLLDLTTDAIFSREMDGSIVFWNRGAEELYGWTREEALGKNAHQLLKTQWPEPFENVLRTLNTTGTWTGDLIHTTREGDLKIVHCRKVLDRQNNRVLETNTDVTGLRQARTALAEREAILLSVAREAGVGLAMIGKDRRYKFANHRHAEILGIPSGNEGKRVADVLGALYQQIAPNLDRAFAGERLTFEVHIPRHPQTGAERFCEIVYEPRLEDAGHEYVIVVLSDITERKLAQQHLERTVADRTAELRESNEHLEAFVYSIAHDLRGPLRAMQGYSQILLDTASALSEQDKKFLSKINQSAENMDRLVLDLLAFGRTASTEIQFTTVSLQSAWDAAVFQCTPEIERSRAIVEVATPLLSVRAHEPTLIQVFVNLLTNAIKFVEAGTRPHVRFGCADEGHMVCIWVRDNGVGIDPQYHERIFRVFERLHGGKFPGTGIGLAIVRKGIERMNGKVGVESEPGKGTRFWIELPKA